LRPLGSQPRSADFEFHDFLSLVVFSLAAHLRPASEGFSDIKRAQIEYLDACNNSTG
jgi:hypothetical protein